MNKHEVKFSNTAKKIHSAFLDILTHKDFMDISISEICEKAEINRSTFYAHYSNITELVADIENDLIRLFSTQIDEQIGTQVIKDISAVKFNALASNKVLIAYLEFVKQYKHIFKIYNNTATFNKSEHEQILKELIFIPALSANGVHDKILADYVFTYYLSGVNSIINKWVYNDCGETIETICEILKLCIPDIVNKE